MQQTYLEPKTLAAISGLELVAKTVVDGFISGMHRSPDFGFSQEFAEYQVYNPGDDLRHVDWNVYARADRMVLKRYRGETNAPVQLLLDTSASMTFTSHGVTKLDYARYLLASLAYLAHHQQRDATGLITFDDEVREYVPASSRQGQFHRLVHAVERATPGRRTDYARPFATLLETLRRRGVVVLVSDFYASPAEVIQTLLPIRLRGSEMVLFHVLDPEELKPSFKQSTVLIDMETDAAMEIAPDFARREYRQRIEAHVDALRKEAQAAGIDHCLLQTDKPLDAALREYLSRRQGRF